MVLVVVDARKGGVIVPPQFRGEAQLRLNLSLRFQTPMTIDRWGVRAVLTFGGVPFECKMPWDSVYVMFSHVSGDPYVFPDDVPAEAFAAVTEAMRAPEPPTAPAAPIRRPPTLRVVESGNDDEADSANPEQDPPSPPASPLPNQRRSHLRVVK